MKREYPILEFDTSPNAVIESEKAITRIDIPANVVICFFNDVITQLKEEGKLELITNLASEIGRHFGFRR